MNKAQENLLDGYLFQLNLVRCLQNEVQKEPSIELLNCLTIAIAGLKDLYQITNTCQQSTLDLSVSSPNPVSDAAKIWADISTQ